MTVADRCPRCGTDSPTGSSEIREVQSGGILYVEETIRCACGAVVGRFSDPQV